VYLMSNACGRPQGGGRSGSCGHMWTGEGQKPDILWTFVSMEKEQHFEMLVCKSVSPWSHK